MDHVADPRGIVQLAQQRGQFAYRHVLHAHHAGDDLIPFARVFAVGHRHASGTRHAGTHHFDHAVIHWDHRQTVEIQHAQEELIIFIFRQYVIGSHRYRALNGGIDENRFIQIATYRIDKFANIGIFKTGAKVGCKQRTGI